MLRNDYSNFTERISFSLEIIQCDPEHYECESDEKIKNFVEQIMFTEYFLTERIDY